MTQGTARAGDRATATVGRRRIVAGAATSRTCGDDPSTGGPGRLAYANEEVAFALDEVTFCMWSNKASKGAWCEGTARRPAGKDPDGARGLLGCFQEDHRAWATEYYGEELDAGALARLWQEREPIDRATLEALNPEHDLAAVREEAKTLAWKTSGLPSS